MENDYENVLGADTPKVLTSVVGQKDMDYRKKIGTIPQL